MSSLHAVTIPEHALLFALALLASFHVGRAYEHCTNGPDGLICSAKGDK